MRTLNDLRSYLALRPDAPQNYKVAVGSLIFMPDGRVILVERGADARDGVGKLEGVGGGIDNDTDLHIALQREVFEEIGIKISVGSLINIQFHPITDTVWVIVNFVCHWKSGIPTNKEPRKIKQIHLLNLSELDENRLSPDQKITMREYKKAKSHSSS